METTITFKKAHLWAAGAILLLLVCIVGAFIFVQHCQLSNAKLEIADTVSLAKEHQDDAERHASNVLLLETTIDSLTCVNDSLSTEILLSKERINTLQNAHFKDINNYRLLAPDERLALFTKLIAE